MSVDDALRAAVALNREGIAVSLDSLGESVMTEVEARKSAAIYHELLDAIEQRQLNANVSVKLTQMGMDFDPALAETIVQEMVEHAAHADSFVRVDMEGTPLTEATLQLVERIHAKPGLFGRVGAVLQAYLYRTEKDTERLLAQGIRMRLCKGAYKEGPEHAFPLKAEVDANYVKLMARMTTFVHPDLKRPVFCGLATHDERVIDTMVRYVQQQGILKSSFEFQMLYGIRRDLQRKLVKEGFGVRVYVPFGAEWYPYFMRRLAERPANVIFLVKNFFKS
ncbi:proline dehydrogenase [Granulicella aggregans]|uniref:proline dehydrogenase n=1 Tax=Granulicella aggregans TaxID=474949 RepID=A0A7W8E1E6_9BACT|nr:proline dehydrogenase family protein [Granulicella aggregans]MBB5055743.1 proline dehydrogenase [Granulicella aggregans]